MKALGLSFSLSPSYDVTTASVVGVRGRSDKVKSISSARISTGRGVKRRQGAGAETVFGAMVRAMA